MTFYSRATLAILSIGFCAEAEEELRGVRMAQCDSIEQSRAAVTVDDVHFCAAERHKRLQAICVTPAGRAVQSCDIIILILL